MNIKSNKSNDYVIAEYDSSSIYEHFKDQIESDFYLFLFCNNGSCSVTAYMENFTLEKNTVISILPKIFFKIDSISPDCHLSFIAFDQYLINNQLIFSTTLKYVPFIFKRPIVQIDDSLAKFISEFIKLIDNSITITQFAPPVEYYYSLFLTFLCGVGSLYKSNDSIVIKKKRKDEILENFIFLTVNHYAKERGLNFYADKMSLSPQHLSSVIKKKTQTTVTDFIASLVIADAKTQLKSTNNGIQEIAFSLNFPDVSTFGKYFKRYTGISPKQYREE